MLLLLLLQVAIIMAMAAAAAESYLPENISNSPYLDHGHKGTCEVHCTTLPSPNATLSSISPPVKLPCDANVLAPDGSEVRVLTSTPGASMASFRLGPGLVTIGVYHRTVDELWYVTGGKGWIWRGQGKKPDDARTDRLEPGVSVAIPVGTHFQFKADEGDEALDIIGVDTPAWPGDQEAIQSTITPWVPTVGKDA